MRGHFVARLLSPWGVAVTASRHAGDRRRRAPRPPRAPSPDRARRAGRRRGRRGPERGVPPRHRPRRDLPVRLGAHRGHDRGRSRQRAVRRPLARQAPVHAADALRRPPRDAGRRAGGSRRPGRCGGEAPAHPRRGAGRAPRGRGGVAGRGMQAGADGTGGGPPGPKEGGAGPEPPAPGAGGAVGVNLEGRGGFLFRDTPAPPARVEPWAALLPPLDPTTMGWYERGWYLGPHKEQIFDTAGNAGPTIWWDGRIVGGWRQDEGGALKLQMLEDIGADGLRSVEREAERLSRWLDGTRVLPRFPSPLFRRAQI